MGINAHQRSLPHCLRKEANMLFQRSVTRGYFSIPGWFLTLASLLLLVRASLGRNLALSGEEHRYLTSSDDYPVSEVKCPELMMWTKDYADEEGLCVCAPGNLYSRQFGRCFVQYTQGPCKKGQHFVQRPSEMFARCVDNPCPELDTIRYKGRCYDLYVTGGPCGPHQTLTIPDDSYEPKCVNVMAPNRSIINVPCGPGFRRDQNGRCRETMY